MSLQGKGGAPLSLLGRVRDMVERAGISNYSFDRGMLVLCGTRFTMELCNCGESGCDGIRLRAATDILQNCAPDVTRFS